MSSTAVVIGTLRVNFVGIIPDIGHVNVPLLLSYAFPIFVNTRSNMIGWSTCK